MTESVPGRGGPTKEAQCYNCGSSGHWAVACPEPTRETPAGLAAWRNSPNVGQGNGKGFAYNSAAKRSKGPIITKYTPPPPPQQQHSFGPVVHSYAPHPPGAHRPPGPYPGPNQHFQPYGTLPPSLPAGYPQPAYPYHLTPPYAPPPPYGPPRYGHHGALGPHSASIPPSVQFAPGRPSAHEYRPSLQPYPQPFPHAAASHRPVPVKNSSNGPPYVRPEAPSLKVTATPPKPPTSRISHPLPPKPPPSHDQVNPQREHKGKRKFERQHHQEKRHKGFKSTPPQPPAYSSPRHNVYSSESPVDRPPPSKLPTQGPSDQRGNGPSLPEETRTVPYSAEKKKGQAADRLPAMIQSKIDTNSGAVPAESVTKASDPASAEQESRPPSIDGADRPQSETVKERLLLLPAVDVHDTTSDFVGVEGEATNPPPPSDDQEDGEVSSDEAGPSPFPKPRSLERRRSPTPVTGDQWKSKCEHSTESDDESGPKRPKSNGSAANVEDGAIKDDGVNDSLWDSFDIPRQADRKRRGSTASRGSRHSSVSSKSSDLNSLEAELLGRPKNQKQSEPSPPPRQRPERRTPSKPRRRQNNTNSAYR